MTQTLLLATYDDPRQYWAGHNYELNLSFDSLQEAQWRRLLDALWGYHALIGPLTGRYTPGKELAMRAIEIPPPTAALTQHGMFWVGPTIAVGCNMLVTRSLFECVSIQIPMGMFSNISPETAPRVPQLEDAFRELALNIYQQVPFGLANIGWERDCIIAAELQRDSRLLTALWSEGGFFISEPLRQRLGLDCKSCEQPLSDLFWVSPAQLP